MDVEGTIQFILEQQAHHEAKFAGDIARINGILVEVATSQERTNAILATLAERQVATEETVRALGETMQVLAQRQTATEETLHALLLSVERHIANHK